MSCINGKAQASYYPNILKCAAMGGGILRGMLGRDEKVAASRMVKLGMLTKGVSDDSQGSVCYFITKKGLGNNER